jgi:hypothetical protein
MTTRRSAEPNLGPFTEAQTFVDLLWHDVVALTGTPAVNLSFLEIVCTDPADDVAFRYGTDDETPVPTNGLINGSYVEDIPEGGLIIDAAKGPLQVRAITQPSSVLVRWSLQPTPPQL